MSNNEELYYLLGLEENASAERIKNAYNIAKHAWTIDEFAPIELKNRCKVQLDKIDKAYQVLLDFEKEKTEEKIQFSDNEYEKFNVQTKDVEYTKTKINFWWRLLYLSLILLILIILNLLYPLPNGEVENQNHQQTNIQKKSVPQESKKSVDKVKEQPKNSPPKEQTNPQKPNDNVQKENSKVNNSSAIQTEKENIQKPNPVKNNKQKENNLAQKTHEKTNSITQNNNQKPPQKPSQKVPQKTQSDFETVSDYFE